MKPEEPPKLFQYPYNLDEPSWAWRAATHQTLLGVAALCRGFLYGLNKVEVNGLPTFLNLLKSRADPAARKRGLLTVSNHVCVMDDPLIWGVLPLSFHAYHSIGNHRWGFGSHDICFTGFFRSHFFTLGQVLPTHRKLHSQWAGPRQPTMTEAIRILSPIYAGREGFNEDLGHVDTRVQPFHYDRNYASHPPSWPRDPVDPFSEPGLTPYYASYPQDPRNYFAPSRYACNTRGWVHIFPEGMIHQSPTYNMRYFKWGIARLILEPNECPDIVPMWIEGTDQIMHESRTFPRFLPRFGKSVSVTFGDPIDVEARFGDLRKRWQAWKEPLNTAVYMYLERVEKVPFEKLEEGKERILEEMPNELEQWEERAFILEEATRGIILEYPRQGSIAELRELWEETTLRVREEVLKLRKARGWPDEDPKASAAATWRKEGPQVTGKMEDGTWVGDT